MDLKQHRETWQAEEASAQIHGWDFSHINGRYTEETDLPWNYEAVVRSYLRRSDQLLDIDTGGGEFLLSLEHPHCQTSATEGYPPNVQLCKKILLPLGITFRQSSGYASLPFPAESFDIIINRHGDYAPQELHCLLKPGGLFVTEQVGADNDRELVELLLPGTPKPFPQQTLSLQRERLRQAGFAILREEETFRPIRFFDTGALVWFAKIIEWEFPGFSVDSCWDGLLRAQALLERDGELRGTIHRYLIVAQKAFHRAAP